MPIQLLGQRNLKNFVKANITNTFTGSTTSFTVESGQGNRFPDVPYAVVIWDSKFEDPADAYWQGVAEIMLVTARASDTLTVTRGVDGTAAFASEAGKKYAIALAATGFFLDNVPRYLNVKTYGAKGDGATNDTTAILAAWADMPANGGVLFFPRGTYILTQSKTGADKLIINKSNVTLMGEGSCSIIKGDAGADATSMLIRIEGEVGAPITDIRVEHLSFDGNRTGATIASGTQAHIINLMNCERVWIESCYFKESPGDFIRTDNEDVSQPVRDLHILNNQMDTCLRNGISIVIAERVFIKGNRIKGYNTFGIDCEPNNSAQVCKEIVIECNTLDAPAATHLNTFNTNRPAGISLKGVLADVWDPNATPTHFISQVRVVGNFVRGLSDGGSQFPTAGIQVEEFRNVTIIGNTVVQCRQGILGGTADDNDNGSSGTIVGNTVRQCVGSTSGIAIAARTNWTIVGNECEGNDGPGIRVSGRSCTVIGNICTDNGSNGADASSSRKSGIWIQGEDCVVTGNRCRDTRSTKKQLYGCYMEDGAADNIISHNNFFDNLTDGIRPPTGGLNGNRFQFNRGYVTENGGNGQIDSGSTSVTIAHGISRLPSSQDFVLTQRAATTNDPGDFYVEESTVDATNFTVKCRNNPGASHFKFAWSVKTRH